MSGQRGQRMSKLPVEHSRRPSGGALCKTTRRQGVLLTDGPPTCRRCAHFITQTWLLVRTLIKGAPSWIVFGCYPDVAAATHAHVTEIEGRGITSWSWWGPWDIAAKMLADPSYDPASGNEAGVLK